MHDYENHVIRRGPEYVHKIGQIQNLEVDDFCQQIG